MRQAEVHVSKTGIAAMATGSAPGPHLPQTQLFIIFLPCLHLSQAHWQLLDWAVLACARQGPAGFP